MIKNKKIAIVGFAKEGVASANYLGKTNNISIFDKKKKEEIDPSFFKKLKVKNVDFFFANALPPKINFDLIVRTPDIRIDNAIIKVLSRNGAPITSGTKIFFDLCPASIIGVTGTKGKGTTSTLIYKMLKTQYQDVFLAGNIGVPALKLLPQIKPQSKVILELSSFQLIDLKKSPHIAVVLMITSDHLDWHKDLNEYQDAKKSIVAYQGKSDYAIICADYPTSKNFSLSTKAKVFFVSDNGRTNGVYLKQNKIFSEITKHEQICEIKNVLLPGKHNLQNIMAAITVAKIEKINNININKVIKTFRGIKHRLQLVRELNGVRYYDDSCSTNPETAIAAVKSFQEPKIIILGGSTKKSDFSTLSEVICSNNVKAVITIGSEARRIKEALLKKSYRGKIIENLDNMKKVVILAKSIAIAGDIVLLSPACASFGMFKDYQDRGDQFTNQVRKLK